MALLAGSLLAGFGGARITSALTSANLSGNTATWTPAVRRASIASKGPRTGSGIISSQPKTSISGAATSWFRSQLYNRIHVFPNELAMGNLLSVQTRYVEVWNSYQSPQYLPSITAVNADGVAHAGLAEPPYTFGANESKFYTFSVSNVGSATLDGKFIFNFPTDAPSLHITATRVIAVGFEPDWSDAPQEVLSWKTDILTSYSKKEQRRSLRGQPRRTLAYTYLFENPQKRSRWASTMFGWQARTFAVPVWQDQQRCTTDLPLGALQVSVPTSYYDFEADAPVMLWKDAMNYEVAEVGTVGAGYITFKKPTQRAWLAPFKVIPMRMGRAPLKQDISKFTDQASNIRLSWSLSDEVGLGSQRTLATGYPIYQGFEVFPELSNWSDEQSESYARAGTIIDSEVGLTSLDVQSDAPVCTRPFSWTIKGRTNIAKALAWLSARQGRCIPFWMPSQACDMEQVFDMSATDTALRIKDISYALYYAQNVNRRDLAFYPQGLVTPTFKRIVGSTTNGDGTETLTLDSNFGSIKKSIDWRRISFITLCRLDTDDITAEWLTDDLVQLRFAVVEVLQ